MLSLWFLIGSCYWIALGFLIGSWHWVLSLALVTDWFTMLSLWILIGSRCRKQWLVQWEVFRGLMLLGCDCVLLAEFTPTYTLTTGITPPAVWCTNTHSQTHTRMHTHAHPHPYTQKDTQTHTARKLAYSNDGRCFKHICTHSSKHICTHTHTLRHTHPHTRTYLKNALLPRQLMNTHTETRNLAN